MSTNYNPSRKNMGLSTNGVPRPSLYSFFHNDERIRTDPFANRRKSAIDFETPLISPRTAKQYDQIDSVGQLQNHSWDSTLASQNSRLVNVQQKVKPALQDNVMLNAPTYQSSKREQYQNEKSTFDDDNSFKKRRQFYSNELSHVFQTSITPALVAGPRRADPLMKDDHDCNLYYFARKSETTK